MAGLAQPTADEEAIDLVTLQTHVRTLLEFKKVSRNKRFRTAIEQLAELLHIQSSSNS